MSDVRVTLELADGRTIWLNPRLMLKMEKTPDGRFFVYMVNGETYEIGRKEAGRVEDFFEVEC